jgi:hypothetical protein
MSSVSVASLFQLSRRSAQLTAVIARTDEMLEVATSIIGTVSADDARAVASKSASRVFA